MSESNRVVMHPLLIIEKWRKGCSCTLNLSSGDRDHPSSCQGCTDAAMKAIEEWFQQNPQWKPADRFVEKEPEQLDELLNSALALVVTERRVSIAGIQRHFRIGYSRAARIVEQLEQEGFVSPPDENGKRNVC